MKVYIAQQNYHIGNFLLNRERMLGEVEIARQQGADLVVFSELSVCGYPPRDFLEFEDFILEAEATVAEIAKHSWDIGILIGAPTRNPQREGKDLFNSAILLYEGKVQGVAHKTLLPNYDVFDEYRYFEPAYNWNIIPFKGKKIAVTICEDIWNLGDNPLYRVCPMDELMKQSPDLMINISASPFDYDHDEDRKEVIRLNVLKYKLPMIYCNAVGAQTEIIFDGGSLVYAANGELKHELSYFNEDAVWVETDDLIGKDNPLHQAQSKIAEDMRVAKTTDPDQIIGYLTNNNNIAQIRSALVLGIRDYFLKLGFKKAILGSSGGIDSAVVLSLAVEALGAENVTAILMPSPYSSTHSVDDAVRLSEKLGNPYHIIGIGDLYNSFLTALDPLFSGTNFGVAEENIQSRSRGNLLMAIANKFGYVLLNTSNKSELATGYGTLYGDMAGGLSVIGDLYKTQVYALAQHINAVDEIIPENILIKAPSAELRPNQKDSDSLPEYDVLDKILYFYIERRKGPAEIIAMGFDETLVKKTLRLVNLNEYKRNQFCPIIRVSTKAFGVGRRLPIVAKYLS
ncbi:MAG: NAD+ synthase [Chitinophagaceae bacterium]|nr:NAD+ synthase [Chitinophagaceae bacterium]